MVVAWDKVAETCAQFLTKGRLIYVEGRLQYRSFQDEEGKERGICEIIARDVQFLSHRRAKIEEATPPDTDDSSVEEILG